MQNGRRLRHSSPQGLKPVIKLRSTALLRSRALPKIVPYITWKIPIPVIVSDAYSKTCSPVAVVQFPDGSVKCSEGSAEVLSCEARLQVEVDDCDLSMRFVCKTRSCVPSVIASAIVRMTSAWFAVAVRSSTYPASWAVAFLRIEQP